MSIHEIIREKNAEIEWLKGLIEMRGRWAEIDDWRKGAGDECRFCGQFTPILGNLNDDGELIEVHSIDCEWQIYLNGGKPWEKE